MVTDKFIDKDDIRTKQARTHRNVSIISLQ